MSILSYSHPAGESPLERLPAEILRKILIFVARCTRADPADWYSCTFEDYNTNTKYSEAATSLPCLLTSRTIHMAALPVMYRDITTSLPSTFTNFLAQLRRNPELGRLIRSLDLSPIVTNNPRPENEVLANPLPGLLHLAPLLRGFKLSPSLQDHLTKPFLHQLFSELPHIESIDLSKCNSPVFASEFGNLCTSLDFKAWPSLKALNLNGCEELPSHGFTKILPQLPKLQSLEVANTQITTDALASIPATVRLTYLNLSNCSLLPSKELITFLSTHPAVKDTLKFLYLGSSIEDQFLLEEDVTSILSYLPSSLRVLNLENSNMTSAHIPLLRALTGQLEELTVGSQLHMRDLEAIFLPSESLSGHSSIELEADEEHVQIESKYATLLSPMEEAVAICKLRRRINTICSLNSGSSSSQLRYLDISSMAVREQEKIRLSVLLGPQTGVLARIEISQKLGRRVGILKRVVGAVGWDLGSVGRRCWIFRPFARQ